MTSSFLLFFTDLAHLAFRKESSQRKLSVFLSYLRVSLKYLLIFKILRRNPKSERIFGFSVNFPDYYFFYVLFKEIFVKGEYSFQANSKSPLILDCGANIGMASLFFKYSYPDSRIIAFEPDPTTFGYLKRNISQNHLEGVTLNNFALGSKPGHLEFHQSIYESGSGINTLRTLSRREKAQYHSAKVPVMPLSRFISGKVDFAKVDIEGSELAVFEELSGKKKLRLIRESIIEYHHHLGGEDSKLSRFLSILEENGFDYLINTALYRGYEKGKVQNVMIFAYRRENKK